MFVIEQRPSFLAYGVTTVCSANPVKMLPIPTLGEQKPLSLEVGAESICFADPEFPFEDCLGFWRQRCRRSDHTINSFCDSSVYCSELDRAAAVKHQEIRGAPRAIHRVLLHDAGVLVE